MNVVLSAIFIVLLLYPGILFRSVYFRGIQVSATNKIKFNILRQPVWEQIIASILPAVFVHFLCISVLVGLQIVCVLDTSIDFRFVFDFLRSEKTNENVNLSLYFLEFCLYLIITLALSFSLGLGFRRFVFDRKLDSKFALLRLSNEWYYWLTSRILELNDEYRGKEIDLIAINILAETKENTIANPKHDRYLR
jgi:hypothetical protein